MVKLPKSKVSKLQNRLNRNLQFTDAIIARPSIPSKVVEVNATSQRARLRPESSALSSMERMKKIMEGNDFYVAQMDEPTAAKIDHRGALIIRFCDPGDHDLNYKNAGGVHRVNMTLYDHETATKEVRIEEAKKLVKFLSEHGDANTLHIHCKYGEQRSRGFARELAYEAYKEDKDTKFYYFMDEHRAFNLYEASGNGSHHAGRLASLMIKHAEDFVSKDPVSEEAL